MENINELNDIKKFEIEISKIIKEVEEHKKNQKVLIQENKQLQSEINQLREKETRYSLALEENSRLKKDLESRVDIGLSEKDLVEVMVEAKKVANDIIQKSQNEALKIEQKKQKILGEFKLEGDRIKEEIINFKNKANQDFNQWILNIDQIINKLIESIS